MSTDCTWTRDTKLDTDWSTSCGDSFAFDYFNDTPERLGYKYCIYCGGEVMTVTKRQASPAPCPSRRVTNHG